MIKLSLLTQEASSSKVKKRTKEISVTNAINVIKNHCKEALSIFQSEGSSSQNVGIFRGYKSDLYCLAADPRKKERMGNMNLYNALTSILPSWKDYPQRSYSVMFSNEIKPALSYGNPYWIFPLDGAKVARCEKTDCWFGFEYVQERLQQKGWGSIDTLMQRFADFVGHAALSIRNPINTEYTSNFSYNPSKVSQHFTKRQYTISNAEKLLLEMQRMSSAIYRYAEKLVTQVDKNEQSHSKWLMAKPMEYYVAYDIVKNFKGDWIKYFDDILNPVKNKMTNMQVKDIPTIGNTVELWTDSKCIMVYPKTDWNMYRMRDTSVCGTLFRDKVEFMKKNQTLNQLGI